MANTPKKTSKTELIPFYTRIFHSWYLPAGLILLLVIGVIIWALPHRTQQIISADSGLIWRLGEAPPRREVLWEPPKEVRELLPDKKTGSFIAPRLIDGGVTLYFSYCPETKTKGDFDIYRARLVDGQWQTAELVEELSTPDDDICFCFSPNGRTMYLYSDHRYPGAQGEAKERNYDIYISRRGDTEWSTPKNLGPTVNTPFDEMEPAIAPDGKTLVFASNQSLQAEGRKPRKRWSTTLRADPGQAHFDLFLCRLTDKSSAWSQSVAIHDLNRKNFKEGAPCFSPSGRFLYFASNRPDPERLDTPHNLDLYRAFFYKGKFTKVENLGREINTPHQETEPGLSPEGYTLYFSSNRDGADVLYKSKSEEVYTEVTWDDARWQIFLSLWWKVLGLLAALLFLAWLLYRLRNWLFQKATAARFLVASLLLHLLIVLLLGLMPLAQEIISHVQAYEADGPVPQVFDNEAKAPPSFEQVAELKPMTSATVPEITRQMLQDVPAPKVLPKTLTSAAVLPIQVTRIQPVQKMVKIKPLQAKLYDAPKLVRKVRPHPLMTAKLVPLKIKMPTPANNPAEKLTPKAGKIELGQRSPNEVVKIKPLPPLPATDLQDKIVKSTPLRKVGLPPAKPLPPSEVVKPVFSTKRQTARPIQVADIREKVQLKLPPGQKIKDIFPEGVKVTLKKTDDVELNPSKLPAARPKPQIEITLPPGFVTKAAPATPRLHIKEPELDLPFNPLNKKFAPRQLPKIVHQLPSSDSKQMQLTWLKSAPENPLPEVPIRLPRPSLGPPPPMPVPKKLTKVDLPMLPKQALKTVKVAPLVAMPTATPLIKSPLQKRTPTIGTKLAKTKPFVAPQTMLVLRTETTRKEAVKLFGGTMKSETAVELGLQWLVKTQHRDGYWSLERNSGRVRSNTGGTAFGLLPFLGAGHTHKSGKYKDTVGKGLDWLVENQKKDGDLLSRRDDRGHHMYSHGLAAIALCEAYAMTKDPKLLKPAQRAVDFIVAAQHRPSGGWRYRPGQFGDTSVMGWQIMALKSAQMGGLHVPASVFAGAQKWLKRVEGNGKVGGQFGYQNGSARPTMTAQGLLALQLMGIERDNARLQAGAKYLLRHLPRKNNESSYYYYHATQVMYHLQGDAWKTWNAKIRDLNVSTQIKNGRNAGSWNPRDNWEQTGGRVMSTSLRLLMLEVYYRHLPLYQQLEG